MTANYAVLCLLYGVCLKVLIGSGPTEADGKISGNIFLMYLELQPQAVVFIRRGLFKMFSLTWAEIDCKRF